MLKIYFDWNCITHAKDKYPYILDIAKECKNRFVFPYSNAHIRDLMVNKESHRIEYEQDLNLLETICGKHLLSYEEGKMKPYFGLPKDFINETGFLYKILQNVDIISPEMYQKAKESFRDTLPKDMYKRIQGAEPENAIQTIEAYINTQSPGSDFKTLMATVPHPLRSLMNAEAQFKSVCLGLDLFGFRPEKGSKRFTNVDTDASHMFYAGHCDVFVSADKKLRDKAKAVFSKYNYQTRVIAPAEFTDFVENELRQEYSFDTMFNVIEQYGVPRLEDDGLHYTLLQTPVLGLFNACHKIDENWGYSGDVIAGIYRYCFNNTPYLFYSEIEGYCNLWLKILPPSLMDKFQKEYYTSIISRNFEKTLKASFTLGSVESGFMIKLCADPLTPVPCPMMYVIATPEFISNHRLTPISNSIP